MHEAAGVDVVDQIPADVVRVLVDDEVVAAVPAPAVPERPVPHRDLEQEVVVEATAMVLVVHPHHAVAERRPEALEAAEREGLLEPVARIARLVVAEPAIAAHVRHRVHVVAAVLHLGPRVPFAPPLRRRRNLTRVCTWPALRVLSVLREHRAREQKDQSEAGRGLRLHGVLLTPNWTLRTRAEFCSLPRRPRGAGAPWSFATLCRFAAAPCARGFSVVVPRRRGFASRAPRSRRRSGDRPKCG